MGKTIILNLSGIKLTGDVLDVGESYGVIYNISKDTIDEVSVDLLEGTIDEKNTYGEYDTCTVFFYLSSIWRESNKVNLIREASKLVKVGGEIYIWDINKEIGEVSNNKVMAVLPSGKTKEFEFKNLNPLSKSNIDDTKRMLSDIYDIKEEKVWEDIFFVRGEKNKVIKRKEEKMKVLLTAINSKFVHSNLAVRYLKAFTEDMDYECQIREFSINDRDEKILEEIIKEKADVVAFSTYIWNIEIVKRLSNLIKLVDENIKIVYGGPEVSYDSLNILKELSGDYVIQGEGEKTYREFVEYLLGDRSIRDIRGLYFKENNEVISNGNRPLMNMDEIVFPYKEDENLDNKIVYYEASRGCPFNCKYCLSSTTHGVRFLNIERVKKELQYFIDKKVRLVKFVDRTFNCNFKFSMAIWEFLINADTTTQFHFEISADILKPQELEMLRKAPKDRFQFEVGVQTTNDEVLNKINRFVNFSDIKEKVVELLEIKNIKQHLDLIAGLPGEDIVSFKKSFNDVYSIGPEEIQLGFLKLLRGSSMREEAEEYGMKYSPYPPYEILQTKDISYDELLILKKVESMVDKYYNSQKFNNIIKYLINSFETPYDFYLELGNYFDKKGYFDRNIGNSEYYKVFLDFNMEITKLDSEILRDIIKYDYLMFNKRRGMPEFLGKGLEKKVENEIKDLLREEYSFKDYYIESFSINIDDFIKNNRINKDKVYFLCSYEGEMIDITRKVKQN